MFYKIKQRGFTLIELLVVIAIVGILAGLALTQYPVTINQTKDTRVITSLSQFRAEAGILYQTDRNYSSVSCSIDSEKCACSSNTFTSLCNDAAKHSDEDLIFRKNSDNSGFCMIGHLQGENVYFCVDGKLYAKKYATSPAAAGSTCAENCASSNSCSCE